MNQQNVVSSLDAVRVIDLPECARIAGVSLSTFRRRLDAGDGPPLVRMSPRRVGVRAGDLMHWIETRRG